MAKARRPARDGPDIPAFTPFQIARRIDELQRQYPLYADPALWEMIREELIAPWANWHSQPLPEQWAGVVLERLESAEEHLTAFTLEEWDRLCELVLPECYLPIVESETPTQANPRTQEKLDVLTARADAGLSLHHSADPAEIPDSLGFLAGLLSQLQGEDRVEAGDTDYNPALRKHSQRDAARLHEQSGEVGEG